MALTLHNVSVTLGGRTVIDRVDTRFERGRITVMLGPNGAGKSSLLRAAAGLLPTQGEITLDGATVHDMPARDRARAIGYLPQDHTVHWDVTARDLVALGRAPHRSPFAAAGPADRAAIQSALAVTDTADLADQRVLTLSGGERARVLLARVLAGEPKWLLADEPLASLDPAHQLDLLHRLRAAADAGMGVVLVLHDLTLAARVADDVVIVDRGRIVTPIGPPAAVMTADRLAEVFGVAVRWISVDDAPTLVTIGSHTSVRSLASAAGLVDGAAIHAPEDSSWARKTSPS